MYSTAVGATSFPTKGNVSERFSILGFVIEDDAYARALIQFVGVYGDMLEDLLAGGCFVELLLIVFIRSPFAIVTRFCSHYRPKGSTESVAALVKIQIFDLLMASFKQEISAGILRSG